MGASSQAYMDAMEREKLQTLLEASVEYERIKAENRDLLDVIKRQNQLIATYKEALVRAITAVEEMS